MKDLFGVEIRQIERKSGDEYREYLSSSDWRKKRDAKLNLSGERCERCGISKWSVKLEVHHKNYDHLKKEKMDDLEVLCPACHNGADKERETEINSDEHKRSKAVYRGFVEWMDKGNNDNWRSRDNGYLGGEWERFLDYLAGNTGREYKIPFWRDPNWR